MINNDPKYFTVQFVANTEKQNKIPIIALWLRKAWGNQPLVSCKIITGEDPIFRVNHNTGIKIINDKIGALSQTGVNLDFAYHLGLAGGKLSFGLEAGLLNSASNFSRLNRTDASDQVIADNSVSIFKPNAAFGINYQAKKFYIGASAYNLIKSKMNYTASTASVYAVLSKHFFVTAGYTINAGENFQIEPSVLFKYVNGAPGQIDGAMYFTIKKLISLGASYRTQDGIAALFKLNINDKFRLGYAFDLNNGTNLGNYVKGTHEVMLCYQVKLLQPAKEKETHPRYFIK